MKTFVTFIAHGDNAELRKDTGQVPYQMHRLLGYEATLVTYFYGKMGRAGGIIDNPPSNEIAIDDCYPHLKTETPDLKIHFLENKGRGRFYEKAFVKYLLKNAKKIDVLNLFHIGSETIFYCLLFKILNPKGKVWLKLDIDVDFLKSQSKIIKIGANIPIFGQYIEPVFLKLFFKAVNVISAEHQAGFDYFINRYNPPLKKMALIPNGVDAKRIMSLVERINTFEEKENIILTVGRIGNPQKNSELLMKVASEIDLKDWKVYFVGPIENGFQITIDKYFDTFPHLREKVFFIGSVNDPKRLYDIYNKAKIFCLPSLWESFGLVVIESMFLGCFPIISYSISAYSTLSNNGSIGSSFNPNESSELKEKIKICIKNELIMKQQYNVVLEYANENFNIITNILHLEKNIINL
jgi:glycosyltransferase involved in cell wall biosynthesis